MKTIAKNIVALAGLVIISAGSLIAQQSGVFKTYADFTTGKMEYSIDCATEKHKIKLNDFLGKDYITVVHDGKPYDLKKAETWGYQLCDQKIIRFHGNDHYPLEDKGTLWVYTKQAVKSVGRGRSEPVTNYFFSNGGNGKIEKLTLLNLKAAFPENHKLHDAIDAQFKTDASLGEYDKFHKHYKINHFLESQGI
jgi:hypothetical protein